MSDSLTDYKILAPKSDVPPVTAQFSLNSEMDENQYRSTEHETVPGTNTEEDATSAVSQIIETLHRTDPYIGSSEEAKISSRHLVWNRDLVRGYRINYGTWTATFKSLFQCHNETVNIWTHLIGFIVCFCLLWVVEFMPLKWMILQKEEDMSGALSLALGLSDNKNHASIAENLIS